MAWYQHVTRPSCQSSLEACRQERVLSPGKHPAWWNLSSTGQPTGQGFNFGEKLLLVTWLEKTRMWFLKWEKIVLTTNKLPSISVHSSNCMACQWTCPQAVTLNQRSHRKDLGRCPKSGQWSLSMASQNSWSSPGISADWELSKVRNGNGLSESVFWWCLCFHHVGNCRNGGVCLKSKTRRPIRTMLHVCLYFVFRSVSPHIREKTTTMPLTFHSCPCFIVIASTQNGKRRVHCFPLLKSPLSYKVGPNKSVLASVVQNGQ